MTSEFDNTSPIPARHCPHNELQQQWLIRYREQSGGPVKELYTGPYKGDAARAISRLEIEGNRIVPPARSWTDPDARRCLLCQTPFGDDRDGGEAEEFRPGIGICQTCSTDDELDEAEGWEDETRLTRQQAAANLRRNIALAELMGFNRSQAIDNMLEAGVDRVKAEEAVDNMIHAMHAEQELNQSLKGLERSRKQPLWPIIGSVMIVLAGVLAFIYWP